MQPTFININGKLINLSQVERIYWHTDKYGEWDGEDPIGKKQILRFVYEDDVTTFPDTPATRAAWEYLSTKIPIATFTDDSSEGEEPKS